MLTEQDAAALAEVRAMQGGERWEVWVLFSKVPGSGLPDLFLEDTGYEPWAQSLARQLAAGLAAVARAAQERGSSS